MLQHVHELADTSVRTPEQGTAIAIRLATLPDGGHTGGFFENAGEVRPS